MTSAIAAAIDAARDLAWRPTSNLPADASDELRFLLAAMRRVGGCSFSNRRGEPYYARRRAVYELRGCLVVWRRSVAA